MAAEGVNWRTQAAFTSKVQQGSTGGGVYDTQTGTLIALITYEGVQYNHGTSVKAIWGNCAAASRSVGEGARAV